MRIAILVHDNRNERRRYSDPYPDFGPAPSALLQGLATMPDCEVHVVCCSQRPLHSPAKLEANIYYHCLVVGKWGWMRGGYVGCVRAIRAKLREIKPDLVHAQGTERYSALAAIHSGFPNVLTIHGNMRRLAKTTRARPFSFGWLAARLERWALPRAGGVFCNSAHTQKQVAPLARRAWLVPNALRQQFFSKCRAADASGPPVLLNIGSILPNKSQLELLEMAERLHQRRRRFRFHFVGSLDQNAPYSLAFAARLKQAENEGFATHAEEMSADQIIDLMDSSAALVHFPIEESFGLVVAEALARNLKLFCARVGGPIDIAAGIEGAEMIEGRDFAALEEAIFKWLGAGHSKPTHAAQEMLRRYHPTVVARQHLDIYQEILRTSIREDERPREA